MRGVFCMLCAACSKPQSCLSHRQRGQLKEAAQAEASPVRAGDSGEGQDEEDDKDEHPTAATGAGATAPEAETLLQPIEGSGQQKKLQKSFQTALTVSHYLFFSFRFLSFLHHQDRRAIYDALSPTTCDGQSIQHTHSLIVLQHTFEIALDDKPG